VGVQTANETWQVRAACRGPESAVFFPPAVGERREERERREAKAKAICHTCAVRDECLEYAVAIREPHGIWGGLNEHERRELVATRVGS
jgi:WhiB family redox-sensing transcriptional regulator